jgi:hypothetical protein
MIFLYWVSLSYTKLQQKLLVKKFTTKGGWESDYAFFFFTTNQTKICAGKSFKCKCKRVCLCFSLSLSGSWCFWGFLPSTTVSIVWLGVSFRIHLAMSIAGCNSLGWIPHVLTLELIFVCYCSFAPAPLRIRHFTLQRRITKCIILHKWKRAS